MNNQFNKGYRLLIGIKTYEESRNGNVDEEETV